MKEKILKQIFLGIILLIVILLFTIVDYTIHGLQSAWSVPDYYFRNKIPFGFLWGIIGLLITHKIQNLWLKALVVSGIIAITLQTRYFIEGYPLNFVFIFLLFHFLILYCLTAGMFWVCNRYTMNKITIALLVLIVAGIGAYYFVFANKGGYMQNTNQEAPVAKNTVEIANFAYSQATLTVKVGDTVTWTNQDSAGHSATADDNSFDTGVLAQGKSGIITFSKPGTYTYHCSVHPTMKGTIIVK